MPVAVQKHFVAILDKWRNLENRTKIKIIIIAVALLLTLALAVFVITRPSYISLFKDPLEGDQALQYSQILADEGITSRKSRGETVLEVKTEDYDRARIVTAASPLRVTGLTFGDAMSLTDLATTSEVNRRIDTKLAESELNAIIGTLEGIKSADVKLNIAESTGRIVATAKSSASVRLIPQPGVTITPEQGETIAHLMTGSIKGLDKENVVVLDNDINQLYPPKQKDEASTVLELTAYVGEKIRDGVRRLIPADIWPEVDVSPFLELSKDQYTETSTVFEPSSPEGDTGLAKRVVEIYSRASNSTTGAEPGVTANDEIDTYEVQDGTTGEQASSRKSETELENNVITRNTVVSREVLYDQSRVAVTLSRIVVYDQAELEAQGKLEGLTWLEYKEMIRDESDLNLLAPEVEQQYKTLINNATGIPMENVSVYTFKVPEFIDKPIVETPIGNYALVGLLIFLIGLLAFGLIRRTEPEEIVEFEPELSVEELIVSTKQEPEAQQVAEIDYSEESELKKQIDKFVEEKPEAAAQLLRNWLSDEWE